MVGSVVSGWSFIGWSWRPVGALLLTFRPDRCMAEGLYRRTPHAGSCTLSNENVP